MHLTCLGAAERRAMGEAECSRMSSGHSRRRMGAPNMARPGLARGRGCDEVDPRRQGWPQRCTYAEMTSEGVFE